MKSLSLSKPHVIIIVGIPGSGKTFFAEKFADTFNAPYVHYDKILTLVGDGAKATELTQLQLSELLKTKQSIVVDGMAHTRLQRVELAKSARVAGYETLLVWVQTDPATARARVTKDKNRTPEDTDKAEQSFAPPIAVEKPVVISGKHTYASQAKVVLKKLSSPRAQISTHTTPPARASEPGRRNITIR